MYSFSGSSICFFEVDSSWIGIITEFSKGSKNAEGQVFIGSGIVVMDSTISLDILPCSSSFSIIYFFLFLNE